MKLLNSLIFICSFCLAFFSSATFTSNTALKQSVHTSAASTTSNHASNNSI